MTQLDDVWPVALALTIIVFFIAMICTIIGEWYQRQIAIWPICTDQQGRFY